MSLRPASRAAPEPSASPPSGFWNDNRGLAAVEMALILPIVIGVLALVAVGGQGFAIDRKVVLAAHTVTDLVSGAPYVQTSTVGATQIKQSELDADLALSSEILYPHSVGSLTAVVSELQVNTQTSIGTVVWSEAYNGATALPVGTRVTLNSAYVNTGATYLIYGQASYTFQPLGILYPTSALTLTSYELLTVRNASQINVVWGS